MMNTYTETVGRYRIVRHTELPEAYKAEYRLAGIDPDDNWALIWSFNTLEAAETQLARENATKGKFHTFRLIDNGAAETIERPVY